MTHSTMLFPAALILFSATVVGQNLPSDKTSGSNPNPMPEFAYTQGWLGADDAYSIPLAPHVSLWLFGDTFVGTPKTELRSQSKTMARNSVGISVCDPGRACSMRYYWNKPEDPKPRSFFDTGADAAWYWPSDAYLSGDTLYVALMAVRNKPGATSEDAFGFEISGTKLATVTNAHDSPSKWHTTVSDFTDARLWAGVSIVPDGNHLIWYTRVSESEGQGYMTVMRIARDKMAQLPRAWEYLKKDGQWSPGLPADDAMHVIDQPISEMSVRYHASIKKWVALSTGPEFPSHRAVIRFSDASSGPWSEPKTIYEFPEMKTSNPGYDKDTFCYAVKEHIEFTEAKIALTYACNSFVIGKTMANMGIYRPRVVFLDIPK